MKYFSDRLIELRKARGLSQAELAGKADASLRSIQNWEAGDNEPQGKNLRNFCAALGVDLRDLLASPGGEGGPRMYAFTEEPGETGKIPTKNDCREHLERFLDTCGDDSGKIAWTNIELKEHFPLTKWKQGKP